MQQASRIAVVTPTFSRPAFLGRTLDYFRAQDCPGAVLRWFVLDDSPQAHRELAGSSSDEFSYHWQSARLPLGAKRNRLNDMALAWNADFICAMDDDDWYGPGYVSDMVGMLAGSECNFAGSAQSYYYEVSSGNILLAKTAPPLSSGNGVLCYKADVARRARYPEAACLGEDRVFLGDATVLQHNDVGHVNLALLHGRNTEDKSTLQLSAQICPDMSLASFPMRAADVAFYRELTEAVGGSGAA